MFDHAVDFGVGDKRPVHALRMPGAWRKVEHVALAEQRLGTHLIEDGARIDLARHLERNARWNIGLDQAGDDIDRRSLRREDQVNSRRARLLRNAGDQLFDLAAGDHHQVGQLVDDDHDQRHFFDGLRSIRRQRKRVGERLAGFLGLGYARVIAGEIAYARVDISQ